MTEHLVDLPDDILAIADYCLRRKPRTEASLRSAVSRSMYAVQSAARIGFGKDLEKLYSAQKYLVAWCRTRLPGIDGQDAGEIVERLFLARIAADYHLHEPFPKERAEKVVHLSRQLINAIADYAEKVASGEITERIEDGDGTKSWRGA